MQAFNNATQRGRVKRFLITASFALVASVASAEPLPLPNPPGPGGSSPHGYLASGSYCVPSQGAQDAIIKPPNGTCPWGWTASGNYCLRSGPGASESQLQASD